MFKKLVRLQLRIVCVYFYVLFFSLLAAITLAVLPQPAPVKAAMLVPTETKYSFGSTYITATTSTYKLFLPLIQHTPMAALNPQNRQESLDFYLQQYLLAEEVTPGWTGAHNTCQPGTTSQQFRNTVLRRINYFRLMTGMPTVTLNDEYNRKAQAAALMMSVNRRLSHSPTSDWLCYSSDGAQAAGKSDLFLGVMGWNAISGYILEGGTVGHRRWILYPQTKEMGTGDIPPTQNYPAANALWVFDSNIWEPRPETRHEFVAWPPPGYVPYQVINNHWSFAYPHADFSQASVSLTSNGASIPVALEPVVTGYGENTLIWMPQSLGSEDAWPQPQTDTRYTVKVQNVVIGGQPRSFTYEVIVFDPTP